MILNVKTEAMDSIRDAVEQVNAEFRIQIENSGVADSGFSLEQYTRYLQMQYHLVKDVQKQFYQIAAHPDIFNKGSFRRFLLEFGTEEGPHYRMAERDLNNLQQQNGDCPLDVKLWWCYFEQVVKEKPLMRLGATCILENIGSAVGDLVDSAINKTIFLNKKNTTFLILHKHEVVNHGDLILDELEKARLDDAEYADVMNGLTESRTMVLRIFHWVLYGEDSTPEVVLKAG